MQSIEAGTEAQATSGGTAQDDNFEEAERLAKEIRRVSTFLLVYGFLGVEGLKGF